MNEENNIENNNINNNIQTDKDNNGLFDILKFLLILLIIFIAVFAAVYTVVDMTMYKLGFRPLFSITNQIEKIMDIDSQITKEASESPFKIENKKDKYIVTIDLAPYGNDENNFDINIENNSIKIKGEYKKEKNGKIEQNSCYQNIVFPVQIDENKIKKETKGNKIKIILPFAKSE